MASFFGTILSTLTDAEVVAAQPVLDGFLSWVAANPGDATNPLSAGPQVTKLGVDFMAAQTGAKDSSVAAVANLLHGTIDTLAAHVMTPKPAAAPAVSAAPAAA